MRLPPEKYCLLVDAPEIRDHLLFRKGEDCIYYDTTKLTRTYKPLKGDYCDGFIFHRLLVDHQSERSEDGLIKIEPDKEATSQKWPGQL